MPHSPKGTGIQLYNGSCNISNPLGTNMQYGQLLTEVQLTLSSVQLKFLSCSGGIWIDSNALFGGILFHLVESGNKQLGNHSIVNVFRVTVVCKRLRIGRSFQCKLTPTNPNILKLINLETFKNPEKYPFV